MSYVGGVNQTPTSTLPGVHIYRLVLALVASGVWTVLGSSDGTTWANTGQTAGPYNVLTTGAPGATGLGNANAWVRLGDTNGREILFRIITTGTIAWWYSRTAGFSSGGSATVIPVATDGVQIITGLSWPSTNNITHCVVSDTAINGVFGWYLMGTTTGTGARQFLFAMEPLQPGANGSQASYGDDPVVFFAFNVEPLVGGVAATSLPIPPASGNYLVAVYREGQPDRLVVSVAGFAEMNDNGSNMFPDGLAVNQYSGNDDRCRIVFGRPANITIPFVKGVSGQVCWKGIAARQYPDTIALAGDARVYFGALVVPWLTGVAPVV